MIKVGIMGASGYGGGELLRWLQLHPEAEVLAATSKTYAGQPVSHAFGGLVPLPLVFAEDDIGAVQGCDVVFLAGGDSASMCLAEPLLEAGCKVIDLGASFRFTSASEYEQWYGEPHRSPHLKGVYGLPELHRTEITDAKLIGNPGCYATAALLALAPCVKGGLVKNDSIVIDGISGVSGAGRSKFGLDYHFAEMNENAWAYRIAGTHRHTGEIEQELSSLASAAIRVSFTPHIVPMTRGVLVTCYATLAAAMTTQDVLQIYQGFYNHEFFIHVSEALPRTKHTCGSNMCNIGLGVDERTNRVTVLAALDNLGKGMAGQAIQNMNIMIGLDETTGLKAVPLWP